MSGKKNLTGREIKLSEKDCIFSTTDAQGVTTFANEDFERISGYDAERELVGHGASVVRHPDTPRTLFYSAWKTLKSGDSWFGLIKNRAKNGDYYWVSAYMTPIFGKDGRIKECQSMRFRATDEAIERAEKIYANLRQKEKGAKDEDLDRLSARSVRRSIPLRYKLLLTLGSTAGMAQAVVLHMAQWQLEALLASGVGTAIAAVVIWLFTQPIDRINRYALDVVDDPIQQVVKTGRKDEVGAVYYAFQKLMDERSSVAKRLEYDIGKVERENEKLSDAIGSNACKADEQASGVTQVATAMNEMTATAEEIARLAEEARETGMATDREVRRGSERISESVSALQAMAGEMSGISSSTRDLTNHFNEIRDASKLIADITKQTHLLALNASIEAARAGEQGRGFAVVADEVQSLAEQSRSSLGRIEDSIDSLGGEVHRVADAIEQSRQQAEYHSEQSAQAQDALESMQSATQNIRSMSEQVASSATEQTQVAQEIDSNLVHIDQVAGENRESFKVSKDILDQLTDQLDRTRSIALRLS